MAIIIDRTIYFRTGSAFGTYTYASIYTVGSAHGTEYPTGSGGDCNQVNIGIWTLLLNRYKI